MTAMSFLGFSHTFHFCRPKQFAKPTRTVRRPCHWPPGNRPGAQKSGSPTRATCELPRQPAGNSVDREYPCHAVDLFFQWIWRAELGLARGQLDFPLIRASIEIDKLLKRVLHSHHVTSCRDSPWGYLWKAWLSAAKSKGCCRRLKVW